MVAKRIIPCLDVRDGSTVKGVNFLDITKVGDPVEMGKKYSMEGADELVYLDISATNEGRSTFLNLVTQIASNINIPFTVGGGISSMENASALLKAGADKISVNSAAVKDPMLISNIASKYGNQYIVVAIDAKFDGEKWQVMTHGGTKWGGKELFSWVKEVQERGAGEILLTSMNHDGTKEGYPVHVFRDLSEILSVPVIASGGAGNVEHIADVLKNGRADAALAASIFHYGTIKIDVLKRDLFNRGIQIRL